MRHDPGLHEGPVCGINWKWREAGNGHRRRSLESLRAPLEETYAALDRLKEVGSELPHRERLIAVNHRFARRLLDAHAAWLEEAEVALRDERGRRG